MRIICLFIWLDSLKLNVQVNIFQSCCDGSFLVEPVLSRDLEYPSYVLLWDKEIPPEDQNNSSETRLCQVSDKIIQVRGWDFLVPQQYIMMDTFPCPLFDFLRCYMNFVSSAYFFSFFFAFVPI